MKLAIFGVQVAALLIENFLRRLAEEFIVDSSWFIEDSSLGKARDLRPQGKPPFRPADLIENHSMLDTRFSILVKDSKLGASKNETWPPKVQADTFNSSEKPKKAPALFFLQKKKLG